MFFKYQYICENFVCKRSVFIADAYALPNTEMVGGGTGQRGSMYSTLSTTSTQYPRPLDYDPYLNLVQDGRTQNINQANLHANNTPYKEGGEFKLLSNIKCWVVLRGS